MTAREVVEAIRKNVGVPWNEKTYRDTFKVGDPDTVVTGIATTMLTTFDVIQRAHQAKLNMIITHEGTWWNDRDDTKDLVEMPLYKLKSEFCRKTGVVIWRFHDHQHSRVPDQSVVALLRLVGVQDEKAGIQSGVRTIPETTLSALASLIKKNTGVRAMRVVGDPNLKVSRIAVGPGYAYPRMTADVDVVIGGEAPESDGMFDITSYVRDAAALGIPKGQIIIGHMVSEEDGMEEFARWLRGCVTGVPIQLVRAGEPYWT
ncbi:MAG TPA: Nif3-like dinuclear metal center hexameric protein [Bryobacteraceae bacterium]|nr:Nif3-like dinuclear metal center hexameric protein [Bryobacteraceae bacterium]